MADPKLSLPLGTITPAVGPTKDISPAFYALQQMLNRLEERLDKQSPWADYEFVDVTFSLGANVDHDVPTRLTPEDPEAIRYQVVEADRACDIYHNQAVGRATWQPGYVLLRSNTADAVVRLLLGVER